MVFNNITYVMYGYNRVTYNAVLRSPIYVATVLAVLWTVCRILIMLPFLDACLFKLAA